MGWWLEPVPSSDGRTSPTITSQRRIVCSPYGVVKPSQGAGRARPCPGTRFSVLPVTRVLQCTTVGKLISCLAMNLTDFPSVGHLAAETSSTRSSRGGAFGWDRGNGGGGKALGDERSRERKESSLPVNKSWRWRTRVQVTAAYRLENCFSESSYQGKHSQFVCLRYRNTRIRI